MKKELLPEPGQSLLRALGPPRFPPTGTRGAPRPPCQGWKRGAAGGEPCWGGPFHQGEEAAQAPAAKYILEDFNQHYLLTLAPMTTRDELRPARLSLAAQISRETWCL